MDVFEATFAESSLFALAIAPLLISLWVAGIVVVDRWVSRGADQHWWLSNRRWRISHLSAVSALLAFKGNDPEWANWNFLLRPTLPCAMRL
jgi:hypothetical protein